MKHRVTPSAAVTAAVTYLLNQPDAAEFRKKHQTLITPALAPGRHSDDYTPAGTVTLIQIINGAIGLEHTGMHAVGVVHRFRAQPRSR